jgi:DNA-binding response OmpR family regulator
MSWVTIIWTMSAGVSLTLGGIHVVVWLQDRKAWANLIFAITRHDEPGLEKRVRLLGASAYLKKPVDEAALLAAIKTATSPHHPTPP